MRILFLFIVLYANRWAVAQDNIPPVGLWREHLPYHSAIDLTAGADKIFCATPYSLFSVQTADGYSTERFSRVTGLSETGVAAIQYNSANDKLLVAYSNSNIDILYRNDIYNIPDIKRDNIAGDKTIYNIYARNNSFYLSSGLGIIVIDAVKYEVDDTWFIGASGGQVKVNGFTSDNNFFYAATAEGLKKVPASAVNPANYANWQLISGTNGLTPGICHNVFSVQSNVVVQKNDSLFIQNGTTWSLLYTDGWNFTSSNNTGGTIQLCESLPNGNSRVVLLNAAGNVIMTMAGSPMVKPRKAIQQNNEIWVADETNALLQYRTGGSFSSAYTINSPQGIATGEIISFNGTIYAAAGAVIGWQAQNNTNGMYKYSAGEWQSFNRRSYPQLDTVADLITVAVDKRDEAVWAGSFGGGLLHIKQGPSFNIFKQGFIGAAINNPAAYKVSGQVFDADYNLWISNYGAAQPLVVKKADGGWKGFSVPFLLNENALGQLIIDDNNYKWIVGPKSNGLICYNQGTSLDNTTDDQWRRLGIGSGNLPSNDVLCVAKDKDGFIWVGTADGVAVIQCPELTFSTQPCDAVLPVVPNGSFAGYLLKGQEVRFIAVDGANRKWIASNKGVFLVNAEGEKVIYQFTEENSPLLSNDVRSITIDGKSGEVFFATINGICSFRSTATDGGETNENVLVFPNPVPPGYTGTIAIRGLVNNAIVKITELDGKLVYQARALGGQAVWDGKNYRGQRIVSGAYLVLVTDDNKKERVAAKIFYISR